MRLLVSLAILAVSAGIASAQPNVAPTFKVVANVDKDRGHLIFVENVVRYVQVQKQIFELVNGQQVAKVVTENVPVAEARHVVLSLADSRVITPAGKQLALDEVVMRLKANSVIALAGDARTPAEAYLQALNSEILVVIPAPIKK